MIEFADALQDIGTELGFAGTGTALAYIGFICASLLCLVYGLFTWTTVRRFHQVRSPQGGGRTRKPILIRGRRRTRLRRPRLIRKARR